MYKHLLIVFLILFPVIVFAQADSLKWLPSPPLYYSFIDYEGNYISHSGKLDSVFKKLLKVSTQHKGRVSIVHIGDSHLQADMMTSVVRTGMQDHFGDLGRGLVFPYQLANSNAPRDISVSSNAGTWKSNRLGVDKPVKTGICGFGIHSAKGNCNVKLRLKDIDEQPQTFNKMVFFLGNDSSEYRIDDNKLCRPVVVHSRQGIDTPSLVLECDSMLSGFEMTKSDGSGDFSFYGVSLEKKDTSGVLYHTIGVNGARYDQYLANPLFWNQLRALKGDLFIVSMGTNEAQNLKIDETKMAKIVDSMVKSIHKIAPKAAILITTPAGSYFKQKKPNASVQAVSRAMVHYCDENELPCWDLNRITDGANGAVAMKKYKLLGHDLVHYSLLGYQLQGLLLVNALADSYNSYVRKHPPIPVKSKPKVVIEYVEKPKKTHR